MRTTQETRSTPSQGVTADDAASDPPDRADPRRAWRTADPADHPHGPPPVLRQRRDGILPAVGAALSVRGETLTCTGSKSEAPPALHPLVTRFLDGLPVAQRERGLGRCPEPLLLSRFLAAAEERRTGRAARRPLSQSEARRALKHGKVTARHIREDGDPAHGAYVPPCRSCAPLLDHFGVRAVDPDREAA